MLTLVIEEKTNRVVRLDEKISGDDKRPLYKSVMGAVEKTLIEYMLEKTLGNQFKAARMLGINRNTMRTKIKRLAIDVDRWKT